MTLLLDTTVLAYATGDVGHPLAAPARTLIAQISDEQLAATTTPEVLQEYLHVRSRRRTRGDARELVHAFASLLAPLRTIDEATVRRAADEFVDRPAIGAFDAVLVALVLMSDELELVTADAALLAQPDLPTRSLASFEHRS
jgi:predicted nucleic acid-binding protein